MEDDSIKDWVELKPSQKYVAHFTAMVESAELKHFITDYYERVLDRETKDDLTELCWEVSCNLIKQSILHELILDYSMLEKMVVDCCKVKLSKF